MSSLQAGQHTTSYVKNSTNRKHGKHYEQRHQAVAEAGSEEVGPARAGVLRQEMPGVSADAQLSRGGEVRGNV